MSIQIFIKCMRIPHHLGIVLGRRQTGSSGSKQPQTVERQLILCQLTTAFILLSLMLLAPAVEASPRRDSAPLLFFDLELGPECIAQNNFALITPCEKVNIVEVLVTLCTPLFCVDLVLSVML